MANVCSINKCWSHSFIETLENRRMMSVTQHEWGIKVLGTEGDDTIVLRMDEDGTRVRVSANGVDEGAFDVTEMYVWVGGLAGDDSVSVDESNGVLKTNDLTVSGGKGNDTLTGGLEQTFLYGGQGDDDMSTGGNIPDTEWLISDRAVGNEGNDTLRGGEGDDELWGGSGNDTIENIEPLEDIDGGSGKDIIDGISEERVTVAGTAGDDKIIVSVSDDSDEVVVTLNGTPIRTLENHLYRKLLVLGGDGNDTIEVVDTSDNPLLSSKINVRGGTGDDTLGGGFAGLKLYGDSGADLIAGGEGNDSIFGGIGDDEVSGHGGIDDARGGKGNDTVRGGAGRDKVSGQSGDDHVEGNDGDDEIRGSLGSDSLFGNDGNDSLIGNSGRGPNDLGDELDGGAGQDTLRGIGGKDVVE